MASDRMSVEERLREIALKLQAGEQPAIPTVRQFLAWFGVHRRGTSITKRIKAHLRKAGLVAPNFEFEYLDHPVYFQLRSTSHSQLPAARQTPVAPANLQTRNGTPAGDHEETSAAAEGMITATYSSSNGAADMGTVVQTAANESDLIHQLAKLAAANKPPLVVTPDATLKHAATLMLINNFAQLPVMTSPYVVKGIVTWASIGARLALGKKADLVKDVMDTHHELRWDTSIFKAIPVIVEHNCVLVRASDNRISGIVTSTDLNQQFALLTEPFLLLGDVESHLRRIIDRHFTSTDLEAARDPADSARAVKDAADLSFGEYIRLLDNDDRWKRLTFPLDRHAFCEKLKRVRLIRNDVMHFDPDGIPADDLTLLRDFVGFLLHL